MKANQKHSLNVYNIFSASSSAYSSLLFRKLYGLQQSKKYKSKLDMHNKKYLDFNDEFIKDKI